jgi:NADPH:quinone reductase-like Zn-dependent oxidoreductase/SAM-dependent methyltransferase
LEQITNTTVCPGTGMLVMALEAVKQVAAAGSDISGFRIKNAEFLAPIRVGETLQEAVETELELNPVVRAHGNDSAWSEIRIFEHYHDRTTQCFRAYVQIEYEDVSSNPVDGGLETRLEHEQISGHVRRAVERCTKPVESNAFYKFCEKQGLQYGEAFSQLRDIRWDGRNTSAARIDLTKARKHWEDIDSPLAHPAVLDAAIHLVMTQVSNGLAGEMSTMIPQKLSTMWISAKSWVETTSAVRLSSDVQDLTSSTIDNSVYVLADDDSPLCAIEHLTMARVSKPNDPEANEKAARDDTLLYNIVWKPQLSALSAEALQKVCQDLALAARSTDEKRLNGERHPLSHTKYTVETANPHISEQHMLDDRLQVFLDLASHETPDLRILEVGAGTGALTRNVLASLRGFERETGQARFSEYVYTDTSADSFESLRSEFRECQARIVCRTLDIHKNVAGEELASFDMIIIGRLSHATSDPLTALKHVCAFLKPGGYLVIPEVVSLGSSHVNNGLPHLNRRWVNTENCPPATKEDWDWLLRSTGFTGIELNLGGYESGASPFSSTFVSKKKKKTGLRHEADQQPGLVLLIDPGSESQRSLAAEIGGKQPGRIKVVHLDDVGQNDWTLSSTDNVVSLLEVGSPRLASLSEVEFGALKRLIKDSQRMLWVTAALSQDDLLGKALYAPATGLLRTVRSEDNSKHIVSLAIESCPAGSEARHVLDVLESCFTAAQEQHRRCPEHEFTVRNGHLTIPRVAQETLLDKERVSRIVPQMRTEPWKAGPHLALKVGTPGMLDTLHYIDDTANNTNDDLKPGEVEIEAVAWPISFRDVSIALGRLGDEGLGYECAGFVTRSCSPGLKPGDRVVMVLEGCMRSHTRVPAQNVIKVPDNLPLNDAVAAILPGLTAYHSLVNVARLRRGDTILIHSAARATGQMAIGVARMLGAEIFATVGFPDKKQFLMDRFGIAEDHIFYSRDTSFARGVMRMTAGRGVDCVLNCLAGEAVRASFECLAPNGRLIEIGKADIRANSSLAMSGFSMNRTYAGVDMLHLLNTDISLIRQIAQKVLELIADGSSGMSGPTPLHLYPASDVERAFRYRQSGRNTGRVIVTASPEDNVQVREDWNSVMETNELSNRTDD